MHLQTFTAPSMSECLAQVKSVLGLEAVILHTRTYQRRHWLGLRRHEVIEITAGNGLNVPERRRLAEQQRQTDHRSPVRPAGSQAAGYLNGSGLNNLFAGATRAGATTTAIAAPSAQPVAKALSLAPGRALLETPAAGNVAILGLHEEMKSLKTMMKDLATQVRHAKSAGVSEEVFDYYVQLVQNQVSEELATEIVQNVSKLVRPEHFQQPAFIRDRLAEQIEKLIPTSGPIRRVKAVGPHIVALIGPTGVGKTTTIAKLAAHLKLREKRRVGLITIDTYRIAAIDQLKRYAEIIGSDMRVVSNVDDMRAAVASMCDCEFILIDTAGRSPNDTLKLNELKSFLAAANPDEVHLVLSATASQACVELAAERFGDVRADKVIFTKLDEAMHLGALLNVIRKVNKSLSYVTTGQDVPDDIEEGKGRRLALMIVGNASGAERI